MGSQKWTVIKARCQHRRHGGQEQQQQHQNIQKHILQFPSQAQRSSSEHHGHCQSLVWIRQCNLRLECREEEEAVVRVRVVEVHLYVWLSVCPAPSGSVCEHAAAASPSSTNEIES